MNRCLLFLFFVLWILAVSNGKDEETWDDNEDEFYSTMGPNSKFLNPNFDEATNLKLALADFVEVLDRSDEGELGRNVLSKPIALQHVEKQEEKSKTLKNLKHRNMLSLLNSLIAERSKSA